MKIGPAKFCHEGEYRFDMLCIRWGNYSITNDLFQRLLEPRVGSTLRIILGAMAHYESRAARHAAVC